MPYPMTGYNANPWNYMYPTYSPSVTPITIPGSTSTGTTNSFGAISTAQQNVFVWVQGEQAAKSYPVAPGNQVLLFDSENSVFYVKSADQTGKPLPLEIYDFKKRESIDTLPEATVTYADFATKEDVRTIIKEELELFKSNQYKPRNKEAK